MEERYMYMYIHTYRELHLWSILHPLCMYSRSHMEKFPFHFLCVPFLFTLYYFSPFFVLLTCGMCVVYIDFQSIYYGNTHT